MSPNDRIGRNPFQKSSARATDPSVTAERAPRKRAPKSRSTGAKRAKATTSKHEKNLLLALRELLLQLLAELKRALRQLLSQIRPLRTAS
jgi:hypothetical protein